MRAQAASKARPEITVIEVEVTERDIRLGVPEDIYLCPVAKAAKRVLKRRVGALDDSLSLTIRKEPLIEFEVSLPLAARRFIKRFDDGDRVSPLTFKVKVPTDDAALNKWRLDAND